jgi:hypothetical protein
VGNLNLQVFSIAFNDSNPSNNPAIRVFDLGYKLLGQSVSRPKSEDYAIAPGSQQSVFNGTRITLIDGTTAFSSTQPSPATNTYRFTATGGTLPVFRTDRLLGVDTTTELTVVVNGPLATYIENYSTDLIVNSLAGVPGHVYQFTFNGTPIVYASQPSQITVNTVNDLSYLYTFSFNGTPINYTSQGGDTPSSILYALSVAFNLAISPSVATSSVNGTTLVITAAVPSTPFAITAVDPNLTSTNDSYAQILAGLAAQFALLIPTTIATTLISGTGAGTTLTISAAVPGAAIVITAVDSQLTNTLATTMNTTNVVVGDQLFIDTGAGFSQSNAGLFTIIAKTANSLTVQNLNASGQTATILDPTQFLAFSNGGGMSNQVQIGDKVVISAGFSQADWGTYVITNVTPLWFEVSIAAPNGIPLETGIMPGAAGLVFYSAAKQFVLIAAQNTCSVQVNGDTSNSIMLQPTEPNNQERPALYLQQGTVYSLSITNLSLETLDVIVATAE